MVKNLKIRQEVLKLFKLKKYNKVLDFINNEIEKDYYWFLILKIETLIKINKIDESWDLINTELQIPYIPKPYDKKLMLLYQQVKIINNQKNVSLPTIEEIKERLNTWKDENKLIAILSLLKNYNLNYFTTFFKKIFLEKNYENFKVLLCILLKEAKFNGEFKILIKSKIKTITIENLLLPNKHPFYIGIEKLIDEYFFKQPTKKKIFKQLIDEYFWKNVFLQNNYENIEDILKQLHKQVLESFGENTSK